MDPSNDINNSNPYLEVALPLIGQAMSRLDGEPTSVSYGSFDRTWWCWKFTDFSATRFQEGIYTLAWLQTSPNAPSEGKNNDRLLILTEAALKFWCKLQHRDGSFDEAYPYERSLAATAFTLFYIGHAVDMLKDRLSPKCLSQIKDVIIAAAQWLVANGEYHGILSNHLAAAAAALQVSHDLIENKDFIKARDRYLGIIFAHQNKEEGWLEEYGGADPGYQSHALFYLADIHRRAEIPELAQRLEKAIDFSAWFIHPDGTMGGEHSSRGTKFAYPAAYEMLSHEIPSAAAIANFLRKSIAQQRGVGPMQMDAWNLFPVLNNYLFAAEACKPVASASQLPWQKEGASFICENASVVTANRGGRVLVYAPGLGGTVKLWNSETGQLYYEDCGYGLKNGTKTFSSQNNSDWQKNDNGVGVQKTDDLVFSGSSSFMSIPSSRLHPMNFLAFRIFMLTIGRFPKVARWFKALLVRVLIQNRKHHHGCLHRQVRFLSNGTLEIDDRLENIDCQIFPLERHVPIHMGSSRYADTWDFLGARIACTEPESQGNGSFSRKVIIDGW